MFSAELKTHNEQRLLHINRTIEKCLRLTAYALVGELTRSLASVKTNSVDFNLVMEGLKEPTPSNLIGQIKAIESTKHQKPFELLIPEFSDCFDSAFFREMEDWTNPANSQGESLESQCSLAEQTLVYMLKKIAFLVKYKLVNVSNVSVRKPRFEEASFEHEFHLLNNSDTNFFVKEELLDNFSDSNAVLLMKTLKDPDGFLNLHPLVIDTNQGELSTKRDTSLKRDIFLFEGLQDDSLVYRGSDINGALIFDETEYGNSLKADLETLIKKLGDGS